MPVTAFLCSPFSPFHRPLSHNVLPLLVSYVRACQQLLSNISSTSFCRLSVSQLETVNMDSISHEFNVMRKRHQTAINAAQDKVEEIALIIDQLAAYTSPSTASADSHHVGNTVQQNPDETNDTRESMVIETDNPSVIKTNESNNDSNNVLPLLQRMQSVSKSLLSSLTADYKSVGTAMNKFGKAIDNATAANLSDLVAPSVQLDGHKINDAIASHLFREGMFDVGRSFLMEAGVCLHDDHIRPFEQLYRILTAFRQDDLTPAIQWTQEKRTSLPHSAPLLEFRLHCLAFMQIAQRGDRNDALEYARSRLSAFPQHIGIVQKLMTSLLFVDRLDSSPYKDLIHPSRRDDIERSLSREYCRAQGLTRDSLLLTVTRCGTKAIPLLFKASRVASSLHELGIDDALPIEVDAGRDCCFHSIFTCPVSKEEASDDSNVPMILPCGHVLSKQSIVCLPRGASRFKCPYCPKEQTINDCHELKF